jgi:hypothetical protein
MSEMIHMIPVINFHRMIIFDNYKGQLVDTATQATYA